MLRFKCIVFIRSNLKMENERNKSIRVRQHYNTHEFLKNKLVIYDNEIVNCFTLKTGMLKYPGEDKMTIKFIL